MNITEEERENRKQRALALTQQRREDGTRVFGGPQPGSGRPRSKRTSEILAEKVQREAEEIWETLHDGLQKNVPQAVRNQTVEIMLRIEAQEEQARRAEESDLATLKRDELIALLVKKLVKIDTAGHIDLPIIEGRVATPAAELTEHSGVAGNGNNGYSARD